MFILDTMVVSERTKSRPDPHVAAWLSTLEPRTQFVSVMTIGEIRFGIERMPKVRRAEGLRLGSQGSS